MCEICKKDSGLQWTDCHGVAACTNCGTPFRVLHYDENKKRVEASPEMLLLSEWVPHVQRYIAETGHKVPHGYDIPGSYYSGVDRDDCLSWREWTEINKSTLPQPKAEKATAEQNVQDEPRP